MTYHESLVFSCGEGDKPMVHFDVALRGRCASYCGVCRSGLEPVFQVGTDISLHHAVRRTRRTECACRGLCDVRFLLRLILRLDSESSYRLEAESVARR